MRIKALKLTLIGLLVCFSSLAADSGKLKIYLPREARINNEKITLGRIGVVRGSESLVKTANDIVLGQIYDKGREIVISRAMISGRLSSSGISSSRIEYSGAEETKVSARYSVVSGSRFVEIAQEFIANRFPNGYPYRLNPAKTPKDLVIDGGAGDVQMACQLIEEQSNNKICVEITALAQGKVIETRQVYFQKYQAPDDKKVKQASINDSKTQILVRRNKPVSVVIARPGLFITSAGRALEDGRAGECIKVKMQITDSSRTIVARVNDNGTVEPLL